MAAETYVIGIAGPSGAGKSYLAKHLAAELHAQILGLDHYYHDLSHLTSAERAVTNFDAPEALEHELLVEQIARLRRREAVELPVYDFATHTRKPNAEVLQPRDVLIVEGLFTLYWPKLRELLDTKVYVDTPDSVCLARRTERDVRERGRTTESVLQQYTATVAPMAEQYVRPTTAHADVKVLGDEPIESGVARVLAHYRQRAMVL
jgi:uridine kinase